VAKSLSEERSNRVTATAARKGRLCTSMTALKIEISVTCW
jgi:hypothetical protein